MEERILDEEEGRGIRIKRTADGETDALEGTEGEEEEVAFEFPEEYDETLAGMSQSQVEEELARREKAREEAAAACKKLLDEGNALLASEQFEEAEEKFSGATAYDADSETAIFGLFAAATKNFTDTKRLYTEERAEDLERFDAGRALLLEKMGKTLKNERAAYKKEAEELRPTVEEAQEKRREAFAANRKHYIIFTSVALFLTVLFAIATAIAADNILRTSSSMLPVVFTAIAGVLTFLAVTALAVFGLKLLGANRLCRENEKPTSSKDGARLVELEQRLEVLALVLGKEEE